MTRLSPWGREDSLESAGRSGILRSIRKGIRSTGASSGLVRGATALLLVAGATVVDASAASGQQQRPQRAPSAQDAPRTGEYERSSEGTRMLTLGGGTTIKMLVDAASLGSGEVEVAEITFPVGTNPAGAHRHTAMEIFYVVEGVLGHEVNGQEHRVEPGMVAVVKPGDSIAHRVLGDEPVRAVVIWVPGGEADRIAPADRWTPIGG